MLEMAFNEMNPYREEKIGVANNSDSMVMKSSVGYSNRQLTQDDSINGGST